MTTTSVSSHRCSLWFLLRLCVFHIVSMLDERDFQNIALGMARGLAHLHNHKVWRIFRKISYNYVALILCYARQISSISACCFWQFHAEVKASIQYGRFSSNHRRYVLFNIFLITQIVPHHASAFDRVILKDPSYSSLCLVVRFTLK